MENRVQNLFNYIKNCSPTFGGKVFYYLIAFRRSQIEKNISIVYGDQIGAHAKKKLIQLIYSHLLRSLYEYIIGFIQNPNKLKEMIEFVGVEEILKACRAKKGCILLTGHFGNWENAVLIFANVYPELNLGIIHRTFKNKLLENIVSGRSTKAGIKILNSQNITPKLRRLLSEGEAVLFAFDQHTHRGGIPVEFFNKKAGTFRSVAVMARYTDCLVIPVVCYRKPNKKHVIECFPPLPFLPANEEGDAIYRNTKQYNEFIEKMILQRPDQWACWLHRRWKLKE